MNDQAIGSSQATSDRVLDLRGLVNDLVGDGHLSQEDANLLTSQTRSREQAAMHPLTYIGSHLFEDQAISGGVLDEAILTEWLAGKTDLNVVHIDPL